MSNLIFFGHVSEHAPDKRLGNRLLLNSYLLGVSYNKVKPAALDDGDVFFAVSGIGELHRRYELLVKAFRQDFLMKKPLKREPFGPQSSLGWKIKSDQLKQVCLPT